MASATECAVGIFARAPVPGKTKTRLIPRLGPEGAASFHRAAILDTLALVRSSRLSATVFVTPARARDTHDDLWGDIPVVTQCRGSLGHRMTKALQHLHEKTGRALLIGTDSPDLPREYLHEAERILRTHPTVLGPATDGGYTLIGMRSDVLDDASAKKLFRGVPWSSEETLYQTVQQFTLLGIAPKLLHPWWDVDEPEDLDALERRLRTADLVGGKAPSACAQFLGLRT